MSWEAPHDWSQLESWHSRAMRVVVQGVGDGGDGVVLRSALQGFKDVSAEGLVNNRTNSACELLAVVA